MSFLFFTGGQRRMGHVNTERFAQFVGFGFYVRSRLPRIGFLACVPFCRFVNNETWQGRRFFLGTSLTPDKRFTPSVFFSRLASLLSVVTKWQLSPSKSENRHLLAHFENQRASLVRP